MRRPVRKYALTIHLCEEMEAAEDSAVTGEGVKTEERPRVYLVQEREGVLSAPHREAVADESLQVTAAKILGEDLGIARDQAPLLYVGNTSLKSESGEETIAHDFVVKIHSGQAARAFIGTEVSGRRSQFMDVEDAKKTPP